MLGGQTIGNNKNKLLVQENTSEWVVNTDLFGGGLWGKVHFLLYIFYMHHFLGHLWVLTVLLEVFRKYCIFKIQFKVLKITVDSAAQFVEFTTWRNTFGGCARRL